MYFPTRSTAEAPVSDGDAHDPRLPAQALPTQAPVPATPAAALYAMSEPGSSSSLVASQRDSEGIDLDATVHLKAFGGGFQPAR